MKTAEKLAAEILWGQYSPENYYEADKRMAAKISRGFRDWLSMLNWENVFGSMTKEILFAILNNSKIYKKDSREVEIDLEQGCYLLDKNGSRGEKLWEIQREPHGKVEIEGPPMIRLNQYFSPVYQIKISLAKYEKSFMLKLIKDQYTKNFQFEFLINEVLRFDRGISYSEQYMTELQTEIFTAWKLYRIVCGLLLPESSDKGSQNKESPNKELLKKITVLAESVGSIHNLELRLYLLDVVDIRIQELQKEISGDLYLGLEKIAKDIKKEAEEYNQKTEIIYKLFLYLYREEEQWKDLLGLLNMPTKQFSALLNEVRILSTENHVKSYRQNQYDQLYYADAKRDRHKLYSVIRKGLEKGQGWLRLPERG